MAQPSFLEHTSYFIEVPQNTTVFKIDLEITSGKLYMLAMDPSGAPYLGSHPRDLAQGLPVYVGKGKWRYAFHNPVPGVWEFVIKNDDIPESPNANSVYESASAKMTASLFGVTVEAVESKKSKANNSAFKGQIRSRNHFSNFVGGVMNSPLGAAFSDNPVLEHNGYPQIYDINIPNKTSDIIAKINRASDEDADLDLYLFDCSSGKCKVVEYSNGSSSEEYLTVNNPQEGLWKILVDPFSIPSGRTSIKYLDVITHNDFGNLVSDSVQTSHPIFDQWETPFTINVKPLNGNTRYLVAIMDIVGLNISTVEERYNFKSNKKELFISKPASLGSNILRLKVNGKK